MRKKNISTEEIKDCIKKFQLYSDHSAFNCLLDKYYQDSCKYASKFLSRQLFSDSISWSYEEVASYVFIAFGKAVKNYRGNDKHVVSFKNYLYQLIKFETIHEIKKLFAGKEVQELDKKGYRETELQSERDDSFVLNNLVIRNRVLKIYDFLLPRGRGYALIGELKCRGLKNADVCRKLQISDAQLKSRGQYIKKLILSSFPSMDKIY